MEATVALACANVLGEGCFWDAERDTLYWVDVPMPSTLFAWRPDADAEPRRYPMPQMLTCVRRWGEDLVAAAHGGIHRVDLEDGSLTLVLHPEPDKPFNRCNDAGTDARGRFWFGTMQNNLCPSATAIDIASAAGSLYRLDPDLTLHRMERDVTISNTVCFAPDGRTFYFADTVTGAISAYDLDPERGTISNRREFARHERGVPDGSAIDAEGGLWNARWDGRCVVRFAPDGSVDRVVEVPGGQVTSCAFGGPGLERLYITTARIGLDAAGLAEEPLAGHLFVCEPGVAGVPAAPFAGPVDAAR